MDIDPPRLTNKVANIPVKFVYSKGSHGVFRGSDYIGQGKLAGPTLVVDVHHDINSEYMKQKDHFALFRNNN